MTDFIDPQRENYESTISTRHTRAWNAHIWFNLVLNQQHSGGQGYCRPQNLKMWI